MGGTPSGYGTSWSESYSLPFLSPQSPLWEGAVLGGTSSAGKQRIAAYLLRLLSSLAAKDDNQDL